MTVRWTTAFLDFPSAAFEAGTTFWQGVTAWALSPPRGEFPGVRHARSCEQGRVPTCPAYGRELCSGRRPEFQHLVRPPGMPLGLLVQRLDDDSSAPCHFHLDLACEDVEAEVRRHKALGAGVVRVMPGWTTLVDPSGLFYCVTRRDPGRGTL